MKPFQRLQRGVRQTSQQPSLRSRPRSTFQRPSDLTQAPSPYSIQTTPKPTHQRSKFGGSRLSNFTPIPLLKSMTRTPDMTPLRLDQCRRCLSSPLEEAASFGTQHLLPFELQDRSPRSPWLCRRVACPPHLKKQHLLPSPAAEPDRSSTQPRLERGALSLCRSVRLPFALEEAAPPSLRAAEPLPHTTPARNLGSALLPRSRGRSQLHAPPFGACPPQEAVSPPSHLLPFEMQNRSPTRARLATWALLQSAPLTQARLSIPNLGAEASCTVHQLSVLALPPQEAAPIGTAHLLPFELENS
eukprot:CAMPEP_0114177668 /NCGR_PEP_ID=MMETSP0043_2-20121206/38138_1 /TAXON_ID=464988 /ORGANISM="Hemiselmis andersenii, Strain CCMP644" /LENGTH=300 /DNA_ID=CAMNT_0001276039 /DNA_START=1114 /DNA_END=2017 /DNA_ORIENTATION=+